jgi:hypothetical protein
LNDFKRDHLEQDRHGCVTRVTAVTRAEGEEVSR